MKNQKLFQSWSGVNNVSDFSQKKQNVMIEIFFTKHLLLHTSEFEFYYIECCAQSAEKFQDGNCSIDNMTMTRVLDNAAAIAPGNNI